jgi:hypothetical protein
MKKLSLLFAVVLAFVSIGTVRAGFDWADPSLCVEGKWLVIDAAHADGVEVVLPEHSAYGDQKAGHCKTPAPAPLLAMSSVKVRGEANFIKVMVDGKFASTPMVTVTYGDAVKTAQNHGDKMYFTFRLPERDKDRD